MLLALLLSLAMLVVADFREDVPRVVRAGSADVLARLLRDEARGRATRLEEPGSFLVSAEQHTALRRAYGAEHLTSAVFSGVEAEPRFTIPNYTGYLSNADLLRRMDEAARRAPRSAVRLSIGTSGNGTELGGVLLTRSRPWERRASERRPGVPLFAIFGNIHGNEVVGREVAAQFVDRVLADDANGQTALLDAVDIAVFPTVNPDGFDIGRRRNLAHQDEAREFPDPCGGHRGGLIEDAEPRIELPQPQSEAHARVQRALYSQRTHNSDPLNPVRADALGVVAWTEMLSAEDAPEVHAMKRWLDAEQPTQLAVLHGGAEVVSLPRDSACTVSGSPYVYTDHDGNLVLTGEPSLPKDNALHIEFGVAYVAANERLHSSPFPGGMVHGGQWYSLFGGVQDYALLNCSRTSVSLTLELSDLKWPAAADLPKYTRPAVAGLLALAHKTAQAVHVTATDQNGAALRNITVYIEAMGAPGEDVEMATGLITSVPTRFGLPATGIDGHVIRLLPSGRETVLIVHQPGYVGQRVKVRLDERRPLPVEVMLTALPNDGRRGPWVGADEAGIPYVE